MSYRLPSGVEVDESAIRAFCQRWRIVEFSLFGSVLTDRFDGESDVDVLVKFAQGRQPSIEDDLAMQAELERMFARSVDLVEKRLVTNPFRIVAIDASRRVLYAA